MRSQGRRDGEGEAQRGAKGDIVPLPLQPQPLGTLDGRQAQSINIFGRVISIVCIIMRDRYLERGVKDRRDVTRIYLALRDSCMRIP